MSDKHNPDAYKLARRIVKQLSDHGCLRWEDPELVAKIILPILDPSVVAYNPVEPREPKR